LIHEQQVRHRRTRTIKCDAAPAATFKTFDADANLLAGHVSCASA